MSGCLGTLSAMAAPATTTSLTLPKAIAKKLSAYNVTFDTPSRTGSAESMPLGNGDITANVWVEDNGDLLFYIGKSDSWSEAMRLLKIGRVRMHLSPNPFENPEEFTQTLDLLSGSITVSAGKGSGKTEIRIWIDANNPVINVETTSGRPIDVTCTTELMRPFDVTFKGGGDDPLSSSYRGLIDSPVKPSESADKLVKDSDKVIWYHRNESSFFPMILERQNVGELAKRYPDPYLGRTFGAAMWGEGMRASSDSTLTTVKPTKRCAVRIAALTSMTKDASEWESEILGLTTETANASLRDTWRSHCRWWDDFWGRSWLFLSGDKEAETITRGYNLQRYMMACQSRGAYPVKFNGGTLTFDYKGQNGDYRNWGPGYWYQNCRLYYWPLTATGDYEMKRPWFDMYMAMLPLQMDITKSYYGHEGAFFPETLNFFGGYIQDDWGWNNNGTISQTRWIRYHYEGALEMLAEMIDYYRHTLDEDFAKEYIVPFATQTIRFFDRHWPTVNNQYRFSPANSLEQYWDCVNPVDYIAALTSDITELRRIPDSIVTPALRDEWENVLAKLPPIPTTPDGGRILPAEEFGVDRNFENPECYTIWPFRLYGLTQPDYEKALATFRNRTFKASNCWSQCAVQAARLGLKEDMPTLLMHNAEAVDKDVRFPAFWKPGSDYVPDLDNGGVLMLGVQHMLLDNVGDSIILLQALPENWEADFRLHAYGNVTVTAEAKGQQLKKLEVTPASARAIVRVP